MGIAKEPFSGREKVSVTATVGAYRFYYVTLGVTSVPYQPGGQTVRRRWGQTMLWSMSIMETLIKPKPQPLQ